MVQRRRRNHGFVLLLIVLSILVIGGVTVLSLIASRSTSQARVAEAAQQSSAVLNRAKEALLAYVIQKVDGGQGARLGNLPMPDVVNSGGTAISYDGKSDSRCLSSLGASGLPGVAPSTTALRLNQRCLGKFPWSSLQLEVGVVEAHDPLGLVPWLAISPNLNFDDGCLKRLNSDTPSWNIVPGATACPAADNTIPYPWMTVVDASGNVLSNRVAAILIAPGGPIQTTGRNQVRTAASPGAPGDYLDAIAVPLGCTSTCTATFDNANLSNTFIQIPPGTHFPANAENTMLAGTPLTSFNDHLIFITIDEIVEHLERRVLAEMKSSLIAFKSKSVSPTVSLGLPWASPYAIATNNDVFNATNGTLVGMFPFFTEPLSSPLLGYAAPVGNQGSYQWSIAALQSSRDCKQVSITPDRWANLAQGSQNESSVLTGMGNGLITWRGVKRIDIAASGGTLMPPFNKSFTLWGSSTACTNASSSSITGTYQVTRSILSFDFVCSATPVITYLAAPPNPIQSYNWSCNTGGTANGITVSDSLNSPIPATATYSLPSNGNVTFSGLRYQPIMPPWFFYNEWYKSAFYAVGKSSAPGTSSGCGGATSLTVGGQAGVPAVILLAGKSLSTPPAPRPSMPPNDYLEGKNLTATTDCQFEDASRARSATYNDQMLVVKP